VNTIVVALVTVACLMLPLVFEFLTARWSRWRALAAAFHPQGAPTSGWKGALFLHLEFSRGSTIHTTRYQPEYRLSVWALITTWLFPHGSVAADSGGLHLKRRPWNWAHRRLQIPWSAIDRVEELSLADYAASTSVFALGPEGHEIRPASMPRQPLPRFLDGVGGSVFRLHVAEPSVIISLPAGALFETRRYLEGRIERGTALR
jgi:hypothetical protein